MSQIIELEWDSLLFGGRTARIDDYECVPDRTALSAYKYVHVRVPQDNVELIWQYQQIGFRYITLDYSLEKKPVAKQCPVLDSYTILSIRKQAPVFLIDGFRLEGSRLVLDPELKHHLSEDFWDKTIHDHCLDFADFVLCAVNHDNRLIGFISCFDRSSAIDMFLVIVHPDYRGTGVGRSLLDVAEIYAFEAGKMLTTSVIAQNLVAMNFYAKNGFILKDAVSVLHYSN